eukprot:1210464-Heterocapsa_arctica.AAC.1
MCARGLDTVGETSTLRDARETSVNMGCKENSGTLLEPLRTFKPSIKGSKNPVSEVLRRSIEVSKAPRTF